jgi:putative endonuclease
MTRQWYFYLLRCRGNSLYAGVTTDLEARLKKHNEGTGAKYTSSRRPVELVYSEKCDGSSEAKKREAEVKSWPKSRKESLVRGEQSA